ncbi:DUF2922 domain-containing protein [Staphylococcus sp. 17KM0847]|uniref:DUF2922 domain-containing protein n=1 Tax=Staphylococcus sp. 17KM0847 TaxID=2583989 RepID=UPI0015DC986D|nr:DUF2922 domain-containing protein [Staphylococcus sp. 17KM0847]QLK85414.1 DUF2922 domain-containing protein [Staphylococcus sp. 17KM0847]
MNSKTLDIIFETEQQKEVKLTLPKIKQLITKELVIAQVEKIIQSKILYTPSGHLVIRAKHAQVTDKTTTILF